MQSSGRSARGSVTLSEDESLLYFVASNPSGSAMFYALNTSVGSQVWSYTASFPLQGIADPVVYKTAVIMGDSRVCFPQSWHTSLTFSPLLSPAATLLLS